VRATTGTCAPTVAHNGYDDAGREMQVKKIDPPAPPPPKLEYLPADSYEADVFPHLRTTSHLWLARWS